MTAIHLFRRIEEDVDGRDKHGAVRLSDFGAKFCEYHLKTRRGRACPGHPRLAMRGIKDVDARDKPYEIHTSRATPIYFPLSPTQCYGMHTLSSPSPLEGEVGSAAALPGGGWLQVRCLQGSRDAIAAGARVAPISNRR